MTRYARFLLEHRLMTLFIVGLITLGAGSICTRAVLSSSMGELFFGESPQFLDYLERTRVFSSDEAIIVAYDAPDAMPPTPINGISPPTS